MARNPDFKRTMTNVPMNLYSKTFIRRFGNLLSLVSDHKSETRQPLERLLEDYIAQIELWCKHRGTRWTISLLKEIHTIAVKTAMGRSFDPIRFLKSCKKGIPRVIKPLEPLLRGSVEEKRVALSITKLYLRLNLEPSADVSSIEDPGTGYHLGRRWSRFLTFWVRKFRKPNLAWDGQWHSSTKAGPNGHALVSSHEDCLSLSNDPEVNENLKSWMSWSDTSLLERFNYFQDKWSKLVQGDFIHSRLFLIAEGGGKTRPVAITDYFTQESMKSLFRDSMKALKQLETDGTYNQGHIVEKTRQAVRDRKPIYCLDLSNATDRFPVSLQEDLLAAWIGRDRAQAWRKLLTHRKFSIGKEYVEYKVGQPMGILSSWSVFALTHHAFIEYCAYLEGYQSFRDYVVLGDDVAIFNSRVAKRYKLLMKRLGVTISPVKSFEWEPGSNFPPSGEIAKRLFLNEDEITPIPYDLAKIWCDTPYREMLTLRLGLKNIGLELPYAAWETLCSQSVPRRHSTESLVIATCPSDLIGRVHGLCAPFKEVTQGPWKDIDFVNYPRIMSKLLMRELVRKRETFEDIEDELLNNTEEFFESFRTTGGPISLSVLGIGSSSEDELHPLAAVITGRFNRLSEMDELIDELISDPEESELGWGDVFKADFNLTETYASEERKRAWRQTSVLLKLYKWLKFGEPEECDNTPPEPNWPPFPGAISK